MALADVTSTPRGSPKVSDVSCFIYALVALVLIAIEVVTGGRFQVVDLVHALVHRRKAKRFSASFLFLSSANSAPIVVALVLLSNMH